MVFFILGALVTLYSSILLLQFDNAAVTTVQWRRQLVGTWARAPLAFDRIFSLGSTFCCLVWFGRPTMPMSYSALFVQPYSLWNDTITGYNGAYAKVNVVFTARRYALARSLLSAGVRPSV